MEESASKLKCIKIEDLKVGMFIVRMNRSWFKHPFLGNQKLITSEKQIAKLKDYGIDQVYIDPQRGLDILLDPTGPDSAHGGTSPPLPGKRTAPSETPPRTPDPPEEACKDAGRKTSYFAAQEIANAVSPVPSAETLLSDQGKRRPGPAGRENIPFSQEIEKARTVQKEARSVIKDVMRDIRLGKSFESERVKRVVNGMIESIFSNEAALLSLTHVRGYDEYTYIHSIGVCVLSLTLGRHLNMRRDELELLGVGGLLHDVGKTKVPYSILYKPGKLNEGEWEEIKKHPLYGMQILENAKGIPEEAKEVAAKHHERFNGRGYPYGLAGEAIGLHSQIAGMVDMYDALTRDQIHKEGIQPNEAIRMIYDRSRNDFDSLLVERFIQCIGIYPVGTPVLLDTEEIGIVAETRHEDLLRPTVLLIFKDSVKRYPEPFLVDLAEKRDANWYKRSVVMPLNPRQWRLHLEDYLSWMPRNSPQK
jgi:putative nucleotidyltransferase with HDIG domain